MTEQTVKCPICGRPYVIYPCYSGDQSACPKCRAEALRFNDGAITDFIRTGLMPWRTGTGAGGWGC